MPKQVLSGSDSDSDGPPELCASSSDSEKENERAPAFQLPPKKAPVHSVPPGKKAAGKESENSAQQKKKKGAPPTPAGDRDSDSDVPPQLCASSSNSDSDDSPPPALNGSSDDEEDARPKGGNKQKPAAAKEAQTAAQRAQAAAVAKRKAEQAAADKKRKEERRKEVQKEVENAKKRKAEKVKADAWGRLMFRKWRAGKRLARFAQGRWRTKLAQKRLQRARSAARKVQAVWRGSRVWKAYRAEIKERLHVRKAFMRTWGEPVKYVEKQDAPPFPSWEALKEKAFDFCHFGDEDEEEKQKAEEEKRVLTDVTAAVLATGEEEQVAEEGEGGQEGLAGSEGFVLVGKDEEEEGGEGEDGKGSLGAGEVVGGAGKALDKILLTQDTLKWYKNADRKVANLFLQRLKQLAAGERSRILSKHLVGSKNFAIFETYLDQGHSAQRILWTESREKGGLRGVLVWYVSKHKHVSRHMMDIDQSDLRRHRQLQSARSIVEDGGEGEGEEDEDAMLLDEDTVLLDPLANTPLKIHEADIATIADLADKENLQSLPLRLTSAEKDVIGKTGTVLVLGRSGTGKTICIGKKMAVDRAARIGCGTGRQLFVCRSRKVCAMVQRIQGIADGSDEASFMQVAPADLSRFAKGLKITYTKFSAALGEKIYKQSKLDALVVWTQINSFIKGSIEAVEKGRPLLEDEYVEELGKDRVRLDPEQRKAAYAAYELYVRWCEDCEGWDEGDRMLCVLGKMRGGDGEAWERGEYHKVYVDEVQDLTQAHIAFLFNLSASNSLFLAGDPAQSVEEGVDFRFQEVRQVAFKMGMQVPQKPYQLLLNFRAHSGILDVAKAILDKLFALFPGGSGIKLHSDKGLYKGPRPGLLQITEDALIGVMQKREVMQVIMPEERRDELSALNAAGKMVLGIRESKGLEFGEVAVVDFFSSLPKESQKRWKEMLQAEQEGKGVGMRYMFPELETQLKLLYTAVTRAQHSLYIIETRASVAGTAFFRFLLQLRIAEEQAFLESAPLLTVDEWVVRGLEFMLQATIEDVDVEQEIRWMELAEGCFGNAQNTDMQRKVQAQQQSARARKAMTAGGKGWERQTVDAMKTCLRSELWGEVERLASHVLPHLPAQLQQLMTSELLRPLEKKTRLAALRSSW